MQSGYNFSDLVLEAKTRWLKPAEVFFILENYEKHRLTDKPPQKPASGSLFLFNKRVLRSFRKDGHSWRRKKDGRTVGEAHEHLKVGTVEALNCYYAIGEQNPNFRRRCYWMLNSPYEHIVLVHYRDISEGRHNAGSSSQLSSVFSSTLTPSPSSYTTQLPDSAVVVSESSPGYVEDSSDLVIKSYRTNPLDIIERTGEFNNSSELETSQPLQRREELLSLNDDSLKEIDPICECDNSNDSEYIVNGQSFIRSTGMQDDSNNLAPQQYSGDNNEHHHLPVEHGITVDTEESLDWKDMPDYWKSLSCVASQEKHLYKLDGNQGMPLPPSTGEPMEGQDHWLNFCGNNAHEFSLLLSQEVEDLRFLEYSPAANIYGTNADYYETFFNQGQIEMPFEADSSMTIAQKQKFTIREISPEWGYASEATKVIIIGSFLCDPPDCAWTCMFGDIEVPLQIIQEGVICCQAPPHLPGNVTLCITSGNRESCSEIKEFEYRIKPSSYTRSNFPETGASKSPEELLLRVRFVQMLLSDPSMQNGESTESGVDLLGKFKACEDSWSQVIEAVSVGTWTSSSTTDWLLQELLKDKLQQWLSCRSREGSQPPGCSLSKKEQGIIHMVAGLGLGWALNSILNSGVSVNFRDIKGWTALHWAARFGRENMVATLIASGASAWAVSYPNAQDPTGKTAASIADTYGHKGLAGYLSEVALTSHLSSLTLEESELSKSSADLEAETTVTSIFTNEDHLSLKDTLVAIRNATQAAARIQSAFRVHSFRKRQQREAASAAAAAASASGGGGGGVDEYSVLLNDAQGLSAASKLAFRNRNARDPNAAALTIQKKYRGWKGREDFLAFRQKVVKIQAHVRGHQVRKYYKVICWAVSVLEKVVLRWRRRGVGLRGFQPESESTEDEDIVKVFRKQKVDVAINEAVSRVHSMVQSLEAQQQYHRMLERYRQAKAELEGLRKEASSTSQADISKIENDDTYLVV